MKKPSAAAGRWTPPSPRKPNSWSSTTSTLEMKEFTDQVDFTFCAVDMDKDATRALEEADR